MINHTIGLLFSPRKQWRTVAAMPDDSLAMLVLYPCIFAIFPAAAWFWGTSHVGWAVGDNTDTIKLTVESARLITILFYATMVAAVVAIGYFVHWMSDTYGAQSTMVKGIVIAGLTATPLFIAGIVGVHPILWLDMLIGVVAICWSVYLLYLGIPIVMDIPEERGFLFASAVVGVSLVILICIMVGSVLMWEFGAPPAFTD